MAAIIAQLTRAARGRRTRRTYGANKCLYTLQPFDRNGFNPAIHNKSGNWQGWLAKFTFLGIVWRRPGGRSMSRKWHLRRRSYRTCGRSIRYRSLTPDVCI